MLPDITTVPHSFCSRVGAKEAGRGDGRGFAAPGLLRERYGTSVRPGDLVDRQLLVEGTKQQRDPGMPLAEIEVMILQCRVRGFWIGCARTHVIEILAPVTRAEGSSLTAS